MSDEETRAESDLERSSTSAGRGGWRRVRERRARSMVEKSMVAFMMCCGWLNYGGRRNDM